jgi:hypothetical protein
MQHVQMPQLQIEDIASLLALAKTAKIDVSDAIAVGQLVERVEVALVFTKLPRQPAPEAPDADRKHVDGRSRPGKGAPVAGGSESPQ